MRNNPWWPLIALTVCVVTFIMASEFGDLIGVPPTGIVRHVMLYATLGGAIASMGVFATRWRR